MNAGADDFAHREVPAVSLVFILAFRSDVGDLVLHAEVVAVHARRAAGQLDDRGAQRLRRHRAGVGRDAAERAAALDQRHALAELGRLHGGALPGRAGANRDQIEGGLEVLHRF